MQFDNHIYIAFNKPFNVLSQFTSEDGKATLASFIKTKNDVYPIGRLDYDSEGLLLLTNDPKLKENLINPKYNHEREYLVFAEGVPTKEALARFRRGLTIQDYRTKPAQIEIISAPDWLNERIPPPRVYETKKYSWLKIILTEGKNRQVRKMTAAIGHPTLRLVRKRIMTITFPDLKPGTARFITPDEIRKIMVNCK